jgi:hypothetical protein
MIKFREPMYSKGPDDLVILLPSITYQKMDWRKIMEDGKGLKDVDVSYSLHFKWFKMQYSIGLNYKKK